MRIISGKYRGRRIVPPGSFNARPTTDYARESLFNILANRVSFESVELLDLFSGTGSISFEFASRGAVTIHLVERDARNISFIRRMVREMDIENVRCLQMDVRTYLRSCRYRYDIVFADPPYDLPWLDEIPSMVMDADILKPEGIFILEHPRRSSFTGHTSFSEHRSYGSVNFTFFRPAL